MEIGPFPTLEILKEITMGSYILDLESARDNTIDKFKYKSNNRLPWVGLITGILERIFYGKTYIGISESYSVTYIPIESLQFLENEISESLYSAGIRLDGSMDYSVSLLSHFQYHITATDLDVFKTMERYYEASKNNGDYVPEKIRRLLEGH